MLVLVLIVKSSTLSLVKAQRQARMRACVRGLGGGGATSIEET